MKSIDFYSIWVKRLPIFHFLATPFSNSTSSLNIQISPFSFAACSFCSFCSFLPGSRPHLYSLCILFLVDVIHSYVSCHSQADDSQVIILVSWYVSFQCPCLKSLSFSPKCPSVVLSLSSLYLPILIALCLHPTLPNFAIPN